MSTRRSASRREDPPRTFLRRRETKSLAQHLVRVLRPLAERILPFLMVTTREETEMKLAYIRKLAAVLAVSVMAVLGTIRSASAHPEQNLVDDILDRGEIVLCTSSLAPWAFKNPDTNKWDGFVPELAYQMADEMGVEIDWVELNYGTMIPALLAGKCDVAFGSFVRSAKRAIVVDFTDSHFAFGTFVALRKDDDRWTSYEQMNSSEFTFAARPDYSEVLTKKALPQRKCARHPGRQ